MGQLTFEAKSQNSFFNHHRNISDFNSFRRVISNIVLRC